MPLTVDFKNESHMRISPFDGYIVDADKAAQVVSPAYDALTPVQRHHFALTHPQNYLNVMRSREEFPENECPSLTALLATNSARLKRMIDEKDFVYQQTPSFYIYRLSDQGHIQTGLVTEIPITEYESGLVKKHEFTQASKEDDLTFYQQKVRASSSPMCLTYLPDPHIDECISTLCRREPVLDFADTDGLRQTVWVIADAESIARLQALFSRVPTSYLTDGHHRAASAARFRDVERAANPNHCGSEPYNFLLVALFPSNQLRILEYNRCVDGLNGKSAREFLQALTSKFEVESCDGQPARWVRPRARGEFALFCNGIWYRLTSRKEFVPHDLVGALDVSILQNEIMKPILGISDPRSDPRISYLSGAFDMMELEAHCRENNLLGFAVYPTAIEDLIAVADTGDIMPPKSTWFDPKLRSGIFLRMR